VGGDFVLGLAFLELFDPAYGFGVVAVVLGVEFQGFVLYVIFYSLFGFVEDVCVIFAGRVGECWVGSGVGWVEGWGEVGYDRKCEWGVGKDYWGDGGVGRGVPGVWRYGDFRNGRKPSRRPGSPFGPAYCCRFLLAP
jgi:hypothetical protein